MDVESEIKRLRRLDQRVNELEFNAAEPEDVGFTVPADIPPIVMVHGPAPAQNIPPPVGTGSLGTKKGTFALEDHTHDHSDPTGVEITVLTGVSLDEYGLHFTRKIVRVLSSEDTTDIDIDVTDCEDAGS